MSPASLSQHFGRFVLRRSLPRALVSITLVAVAAAIAISETIVFLAGRGDYGVAAVASSTSAIIIAPLIGTVVLRMFYALDEAHRQLAEVSCRDYLTGISNRRHFMSAAQREWEMAYRHSMGGALLMIDVDDFKRVNDSHGHPCGDSLLCKIADAMRDSTRSVDVLGRYGGEEFVAYLPHADLYGAIDVAERIRMKVESATLDWAGHAVTATVSIGVAALRPQLDSLDAVIREADEALYAAKAAGRNRVQTTVAPAAGRESVPADR